MNVVSKYNLTVAAVTTVLSAILGRYYYLFVGFLLCNVLDWLTGWYRSYKLHQESSYIGLKGIVKKVGYWAIILVSFLIPNLLVQFLNDMLHIDAGFLILFGWFTLATLLINELRSILENLVEAGFNVPTFLVQGLAVAAKLVTAHIEFGEDEDTADGGPKEKGDPGAGYVKD